MMNKPLLKCLLLFLALAYGQVQAAEHITYYVNDALGSPIMAMDEQGAVVWQESYQPYGQRQVKPAAANYDEQFYTGKQEEPDIGLQYFGARWYDPEAGRFTSIDPVGVQEGNTHSFNRYTYANNNPYKYVDPDGRRPLTTNEKAFVSAFFGKTVNVNKIDLKGRSIGNTSRAFSPSKNKAHVPNKYFSKSNPNNELDFSNPTGMSIFAHEIMHTWQREKGEQVTLPALWAQTFEDNPYAYDTLITEPVEMLNQFEGATVEQQGQMVQDFVYDSIKNRNVDKYDGISNKLKH